MRSFFVSVVFIPFIIYFINLFVKQTFMELLELLCKNITYKIMCDIFFKNYYYFLFGTVYKLIVLHRNGFVSLFNGISTLFRLFNAKAILLEEQ